MEENFAIIDDEEKAERKKAEEEEQKEKLPRLLLTEISPRTKLMLMTA